MEAACCGVAQPVFEVPRLQFQLTIWEVRHFLFLEPQFSHLHIDDVGLESRPEIMSRSVKCCYVLCKWCCIVMLQFFVLCPGIISVLIGHAWWLNLNPSINPSQALGCQAASLNSKGSDLYLKMWLKSISDMETNYFKSCKNGLDSRFWRETSPSFLQVCQWLYSTYTCWLNLSPIIYQFSFPTSLANNVVRVAGPPRLVLLWTCL